MSQKVINADDNASNKDNGKQDNDCNIVVKIGGSNRNEILPMDGNDSSENREKAPEKQRPIFSDDSSSCNSENLSKIVSSLTKKKEVTKGKPSGIITRKTSKSEKQRRKPPPTPTSKKRKQSNRAKQKTVARTSKASKSTATVPTTKRKRGRPRKNPNPESTSTNTLCITSEDAKDTIDESFTTPTNLFGSYRVKHRQSVSILAPLKKKRERLSKKKNNGNIGRKNLPPDGVSQPNTVNKTNDSMDNISIEADETYNQVIMHTEEDVADELLLDSEESNKDNEMIADTRKNMESNKIAGLLPNVIDNNTSTKKKKKDSCGQKPKPFEAIKKCPVAYEKYLSDQRLRRRRLTVAKKYAETHNMDVKLVTKMLKNDELLYDESTKSITMNMNKIESSDGDNNNENGENASFVIPPELKARILSIQGKNNSSNKYMLLSDDEIAKMWLCREFIFGKNVSPSPITQPNATDTKHGSTEKDDAPTQEIVNDDNARLVD